MELILGLRIPRIPSSESPTPSTRVRAHTLPAVFHNISQAHPSEAWCRTRLKSNADNLSQGCINIQWVSGAEECGNGFFSP